MDIQFETTGCRLNQIESESAARAFIENSFTVSLSSLTAKSQVFPKAILGVINTCAVTQKAEQKDRRIIRLMLEKLPNATIVVTGCYAQLAKEYLCGMNDRIAVLPGQLKSRIVECAKLLRKAVGPDGNNGSFFKNGVFDASSFARYMNDGLFSKDAKMPGTSENPFILSTDSFVAHSRASLKIQDGCNSSCSYCAIHIARGKSVSLDASVVIERVKKLEEAGQSEVVITTVNIAQYKSQYNGKDIRFAELLALCLENTATINFRISSLYPQVVDDYFCDVIKDKRVRPHFHLSVQSGSDDVLKRMARAYKANDVLQACRKLKAAKINPFLSCDIITGFPGETDDDFEQTLNLCKEAGFTAIHVFPFSEREGTLAATMKNKVPQSISGERAKCLSEYSFQSKARYISKCVGQTFDGVMETVKKRAVSSNEGDGVVFHAITENFLHCEIHGFDGMLAPRPGQKVKLEILGPIKTLSAKGGETECLAKFV